MVSDQSEDFILSADFLKTFAARELSSREKNCKLLLSVSLPYMAKANLPRATFRSVVYRKGDRSCYCGSAYLLMRFRILRR